MFFHLRSQGNLTPCLFIINTGVDIMHLTDNIKLKFERNSCLEYYQMTCIVKTKHTSKRGLFHGAFAQNLGHPIPLEVTSFQTKL